MAHVINDVDTLKEYIEAVMARAEHHGPNVGAIALTLAGAIVWRTDPEPIEVHEERSMSRHGPVGQEGGQRYAFRYNHETGEIEMRLGSVRETSYTRLTTRRRFGKSSRSTGRYNWYRTPFH
jgi:hypothetical protein